LVITACGTLPEPFYGNPGPAAAKLATPPAPVLMVPPAPGPNGATFAQDIATALANLDVPAVAGPIAPVQWHLAITTSVNGATYKIIGPEGKTYGTQPGTQMQATTPDALAAEANTDALTLAKLLSTINAEIQQSNPQSLENRPPRLFMASVTGAPTDGDTALAFNMQHDLAGPDDEVVTDPSRADFIITGEVKTSPYQNGQILVELDWSVADINHRKVGQVTQLHALSPADITPHWGDVAAAAATEAATGIQHVITNDTLHKPPGPTS
jgi:hypothetical protein